MSRPTQASEESAIPTIAVDVISEIIAFLVRCDAEYAAQETPIAPQSPTSGK